MTFGKFSLGCGLIALAMFATVGCDTSKTTPPTTASSGTSSGDDQGHAHDHGEHGPHGGHMLHLEPDGAHAEWNHDDDAKLITVYLDELASAPSEVKFVVKAGDTEPQTFALSKAEGGTGGGTWTVTSDALLTHLAMGEAAQIQLIVVSGDKEMSTKIDHSDEHHHH